VGLRFRRSVRLLPGVRLNISRSGVSASIGGRGATLNVGGRGIRTTVGIPGAGLSYSSFSRRAEPRAASSARVSSTTAGTARLWINCILLFVIFVLFYSTSQCTRGTPTPSPPVERAALAAAAMQVTASSLKCRVRPGADARVRTRLVRGDHVAVAQRAGRWTRLADASGGCWVSSRYLASPSDPARD
jgi:Protein of unknown function (DUF4236)